MEQALVQIAIQVPTVALTFLFAKWIIEAMLTRVESRMDKMLDLMKEHLLTRRR